MDNEAVQPGKIVMLQEHEVLNDVFEYQHDRPYMVIDIETLGVSLDAPIIAVAILNHKGKGAKLKFSVADQIENGALIDDETINWWLNRPAATWLDEYKESDAKELFYNLKLYYHGGDVWTRGNDFDIPIIGNFLKRSGAYASNRGWHPWRFAELHNVRTAECITGKYVDAEKAHDPMSDCKDCLWIINEFYRHVELARSPRFLVSSSINFEEDKI